VPSGCLLCAVLAGRDLVPGRPLARTRLSVTHKTGVAPTPLLSTSHRCASAHLQRVRIGINLLTLHGHGFLLNLNTKRLTVPERLTVVLIGSTYSLTCITRQRAEPPVRYLAALRQPRILPNNALLRSARGTFLLTATSTIHCAGTRRSYILASTLFERHFLFYLVSCWRRLRYQPASLRLALAARCFFLQRHRTTDAFHHPDRLTFYRIPVAGLIRRTGMVLGQHKYAGISAWRQHRAFSRFNISPLLCASLSSLGSGTG